MGRKIGFIIFAGVAALIAALVVHSALKRSEEEIAKAQAQMVEIVVAARDLPLGSRIQPDSVRLVRWSREALPPGSFQDLTAVMNSNLRRAIVTNEPLVDKELYKGDRNAGVMALVIPKGMRAMSVEVDEVSDIAGFVLPHTRVDVLAAMNNSQGGQKPFSKIVVQDVEVLAVAQEMEQQKDQPQVVKVVTLLVKPEEAERLALASHEGVLRLAMRNYDDRSIVISGGADLNQLQSVYSPATPAATHRGGVVVARPARFRVEIMRDGKAAESASFVERAPANRRGAIRDEQWQPVDDDPPAAIARTGKVGAATPQPSGQASNSDNAAAMPRASQPAASADGQEANQAATPLSKTIDVDP